MAVRLDEIFRVWPAREERIVLTGHWHILSGIIATIILLYYADLAGLKDRARKIFGWSVIIFSDLAFAAVTIFSSLIVVNIINPYFSLDRPEEYKQVAETG